MSIHFRKLKNYEYVQFVGGVINIIGFAMLVISGGSDMAENIMGIGITIFTLAFWYGFSTRRKDTNQK